MICEVELSVREVAHRSLELRLRNIGHLVTSVRTKDDRSVERIHQLRTETRRADAALRLFKNWLPCRRERWTKECLDEIRATAGTVRDLDVMQPLLKKLGEQLPKPARLWLLDRVVELRTDSVRSLKKFCHRLRKQDFERRSRLLARRIRWRQTTTEPNLSDHCAIVIRELEAKIVTAVESEIDEIQPLHRLRILCRRMRYTLDLISKVVPSATNDQTRGLLSEMQDKLGFINDQMSVLKFLRHHASECRSHSIKLALQQASDSLETSLKSQMRFVAKDTIEKARQI